ncbi:MAG: DUF4097 family beta strand repeat protein [Calditrichaeota bacterium]|nr:DUF4097 family beta strand repeat protein [Candidatus Cloacimonadota bacterium]MCB1046877.1 DUF4097 family beta strand repeat protein [Calditrichota bacterium]
MTVRHKLLLGLLGSNLLAAVAFGARIEDTLDKDFTVHAGGTLFLDTAEGSVEVVSWDKEQVRVTIERKVKARNEEEAREVLDHYRFEMDGKGDDVQVTVDRTGRHNYSDQIELSFAISVPRTYSVDIATSGGGIRVGDLDGRAICETAGGGVTLGAISGPVQAITAGGSINLKSCDRKAVLETAGGDIRVSESVGELVATTSGGSIRIEQSRGPVVARTSGGNISLSEAGAAFDLETAGGNIETELTAQPAEDCHASTAAGNISVTVADGLNLDLDAMTSAGRIRTQLPIAVTGEFLEYRASGQLNKGGPELVLRTSAGNIDLDRNANTAH